MICRGKKGRETLIQVRLHPTAVAKFFILFFTNRNLPTLRLEKILSPSRSAFQTATHCTDRHTPNFPNFDLLGFLNRNQFSIAWVLKWTTFCNQPPDSSSSPSDLSPYSHFWKQPLHRNFLSPHAIRWAIFCRYQSDANWFVLDLGRTRAIRDSL